jgi:hypothetical protein
LGHQDGHGHDEHRTQGERTGTGLEKDFSSKALYQTDAARMSRRFVDKKCLETVAVGVPSRELRRNSACVYCWVATILAILPDRFSSILRLGKY